MSEVSSIDRVKELVVQSANEMRLAYQCMSNGRNDMAIKHRERAVELAQEARAINAEPTERQREKVQQELLTRADDMHEYLMMKGRV